MTHQPEPIRDHVLWRVDAVDFRRAADPSENRVMVCGQELVHSCTGVEAAANGGFLLLLLAPSSRT
jgi:hypothetical protein